MRLAVVRVTVLVAACSFGARAEARNGPPGDEAGETDGDAPAEAGAEGAEDVPATASDETDPPDDAAAQARHWFVEAQRLAQEGRLGEAGESFDRSYAAVPEPNALFNAATAYELAGQPLQARSRYVAYVGLEPAGPDLEEATQGISRVEAKLSRLLLEYPDHQNPQKVVVDGQEVPLDAFPLYREPGPVRVEITDASGETTTADYQLRPAEARVVAVRAIVEAPRTPPVTVDPPAGPTPEELRAARRAKHRKRVRIAFWPMASLTVAGAAGVGVTGVLTRRAKDDFQTAHAACTPMCNEGGELEVLYPAEEEARFEELRTTTNTLIAVTATVGAAAVVLAAVGFRKVGKKKAGNVRASGRARVQAHPAGIRLRF